MTLLPLKCLAGQPADPQSLAAEQAEALRFGRVTLGQNHLFLYRPLGLGGGYIPYAAIDRWYVRQLEATFEVSSFYSYMFVVEYPHQGGFEEFAIDFEDKKKLDGLRAALRETHPELTMGRDPSRRTKHNW